MRPVPLLTISYRKSTLDISLADLLPWEELPKVLRVLKDTLDYYETIDGAVGTEINSYEHDGCISDCCQNATPVITTTYHMGPESPPFDIDSISSITVELIFYWYIQKDYVWHCSGPPNPAPPCPTCHENAPPNHL
jgi:hypothetical protein